MQHPFDRIVAPQHHLIHQAIHKMTCTALIHATGFVSCGVVVLLLDLLLKRGPFYAAAALGTLFRCVALQVGGQAMICIIGTDSSCEMIEACRSRHKFIAVAGKRQC